MLVGMLFLAAVPANAQQEDGKLDEGEVLTRGPVHEAYANPGVTPTEAPPIVPKQPPDPIDEQPPDQKPDGDNVVWIPGYFVWDDEREDFIWLSGFWRTPPPGRTWMPGTWRQVEDGWQWTPGFWAAAKQENVQFLPPPPAPLEAAPSTPAPSEDSIFTPGTWVYRDSRYLWRPGCWIPYRPGWVWVPAHYVWTPVGWVFVDGYWDFPLRERGLLFAPVYFARRPWLRPGWVYTPRYAIYDDFVVGALFLRPRWGGYWFGDYFGAVYERRGFVAWIDIRFGRGVYDPLFSFYIRFHRRDREWDRDLRALYAARHNGDGLPPRTLVQQTTIVQNINVNKNVTNITNIKNVTAVAPLTKIDTNIVKLRPVSAEQRTQERKAVERIRVASVQRNKLETQLLAKGPAPVKPTDPPRTAKLDLPTTTKQSTTIKPPPPPTHAPPVQAPKDAKPLDLIKNKDTSSKPPVVNPKKDAPPPPPAKKDAPPPAKKDAPPAKKDAPPPPPAKKDAPPPPAKKDAPPAKKDKDKEKEKKQASLATPPLQRQAVAVAPQTEPKTAVPIRNGVETTAPVRQSKPASAAPRDLHASAHPSTGNGLKEKGRQRN
jgi:hypothetical protein